jgi:enoyl-CoA hydratase
MTLTTDKMLAEVEAGIGIMTFNNPVRHNAVSLEMWQAATTIIDRFTADPAVRVIIVRGAGEKSFVSGADISRFADERAERDAVARYEDATEAAYAALKGTPKPTIAMINGYCIGGGANLAVCCDLRICSETARFSIPAARLGVGYGYNRIRRLLDVIPPAFASEIFFTARKFSATEAEAMHFVNRVVPADELQEAVFGIAREIADNAPLVIKSVKRIIREALRDPTERDLDLCAELVQACFESRDYVEGRAAFAEKRAPVFTGT